MEFKTQSRSFKTGNGAVQIGRAAHRVISGSADAALQAAEPQQQTLGQDEVVDNEQVFVEASFEQAAAIPTFSKSVYRSTAQKISSKRDAAHGVDKSSGAFYNARRKAQRIKRSAETSAATARKSTRKVRETSRAAGRVARRAVHAAKSILRALIDAAKALILAISAGGWTAVVIIVLICFIGLITASPYGIFLANEDASSMVLRDMVGLLNEEYYKEIELIKERVPHDRFEIEANDGVTAVRWDEVLAVYAVMLSTDPEAPTEVVTSNALKLDRLREILRTMNEIRHNTKTTTKEIVVEVLDEDGNTVSEIRTISETVLTVSISHKTPGQIISDFRLTSQQTKLLNDLLSPSYSSIWASLIGGFSAGGEIIPSNATWIPTGPFVWPLPVNGSLNSPFGYRYDPISGEYKFHGGIDLGAAQGTPIRAAADGVVTVANGVDSWGGGYGYHVRIQHADGYDTLYGHCSSICVGYGQTVKQGEVIAYVGSTGYSTGNHLHFEVYSTNNRISPLLFFRAI